MGKLSYQRIVDQLLNTLKRSTLAKSTLSRIYHTIANIKKAKKINIKETNEFGIRYIQTNDYKELSE